MHLGYNVFAVDDDLRSPGRPERNMQHGPVLCEVDLIAPEHRVDALADTRLLGELEQELQSLGRDPVLRIIEMDSERIEAELLGASGIPGEELSQMFALDRLI